MGVTLGRQSSAVGAAHNADLTPPPPMLPSRLLFCFLMVLATLPSTQARAAAPDTPARSMLERSRAAMRSDPEQGRKLAEQALADLDQAGAAADPDALVLAHWLLSDYHAERDRAAAEVHLGQARALLPRAPRLRASLLGCEGDLRELAGDSVQAMALYEQSVAVAEQMHEDEQRADGLYRRGYLRGVRGEFANGLFDLRLANQLYERLGMPQQALIS